MRKGAGQRAGPDAGVRHAHAWHIQQARFSPNMCVRVPSMLANTGSPTGRLHHAGSMQHGMERRLCATSCGRPYPGFPAQVTSISRALPLVFWRGLNAPLTLPLAYALPARASVRHHINQAHLTV